MTEYEEKFMYPDRIINNKENFEYFIKMFSEYRADDDVNREPFVYYNAENDPGLSELYSRYNLKSYTNKQTFKTALFFMTWVCNRLYFKELAEYDGRQNATEILNFCKKNKVTVNCLCHATVLSEFLLALNYKVKKIFALPFDLLPNENHVILDVFMPDLNKWVMLDPSVCSYLTDCNNTPLSVREIRENLVCENKMYIKSENEIYNYFHSQNEALIDTDVENCYMAYLYKDFFRFIADRFQHSDSIDTSDVLMLLPVSYLKPDIIIDNYAGKKGKIRTTNAADYFWG